jgi:hypothetical protein
MKTEELRTVMEEFGLYDNALLFHAYRPYMRDYELIVYCDVGPAPQGTYSYLFKYCVHVHVVTSLPDSAYRASLDERLIDYEAGKDLDGYLWGVKWAELMPGWTLQPDSENAADWSRRLGIDFHEVIIQSNAYVITLIFSDLVVTRLSEDFKADSGGTYRPNR